MTNRTSEAQSTVTRLPGGMRAAAIVFVFALPALIGWWMPSDAGTHADVSQAPPASTADTGTPAGYLSGALSVDPRDEPQPESF